MAKIKNQLITPTPRKDEGHLEVSYTTDRNSEWFSHSQKLLKQFLIQLNIYLQDNPAISVLGIYPNVVKIYVHLKNYMRTFIVFSITKDWIQPKSLSTRKR